MKLTYLSYSCDEPRLNGQVLSVCTVQFKSVCDGVKAESARIVIESDEVSLDPTCGAFITMNPGYLGRSELPEGLKALFRPITVMVTLDIERACANQKNTDMNDCRCQIWFLSARICLWRRVSRKRRYWHPNSMDCIRF